MTIDQYSAEMKARVKIKFKRKIFNIQIRLSNTVSLNQNVSMIYVSYCDITFDFLTLHRVEKQPSILLTHMEDIYPTVPSVDLLDFVVIIQF